ncbi:MAG: ADP-ribosyl-[dinitrogen reductase] hydrolase [Opitutaceae bacterium]|jgi:ADP-ribosyl-[dinitrogen reductase] hydrolase
MNAPSLHERALGAYLGLAVGDALGATVEFMTSREIAVTYRVHREIIGGGWLHLKPGQVTDDTQMSLALGSAIIASPSGWDLHAAADVFVTWMQSRPPDIGNTCRRGIRRYQQTGSLSSVPSDDEAGNGAAMRNLPVVLSTLGNEPAFHDRSLAQAHITHYHPLSDAAVITLGDITRAFLRGAPLTAGVCLAHALVADHPSFKFRPWPGRTSGYVVDTVQTVFDAVFNTDTFEDCLVTVVNRGGDADTTGALAGQLAGAFYGIKAIPPRWLKRLDPLVARNIRAQVDALLALSARP